MYAGGYIEVEAEYGTVVAVSDDGEYLAIGAPFEDIGSQTNAGAVYVYTEDSGSWSYQTRLTASDGAKFDGFGGHLDFDDDGDLLIIGANQKDNGSPGKAYVFTRSGSSWSEDQTLAGTSVDGALFSSTISIDGSTVMIAAKYDGSEDDDDDEYRRGEIYVYTYSGSSWALEEHLVASDWEKFANFGVDLDFENGFAAIGARQADGEEEDTGAVYIFSRSGTTWTEETKITHEDSKDGDWFGFEVDLDEDAETLVIGVPHDDEDDNDPTENTGSAFIYTGSEDTWSEQTQLWSSDGRDGDCFGSRVSMSSDGDSILIGAPCTDVLMVGSNVGTAYNFTLSGTTWSEEHILEASDQAHGDAFGTVVTISTDGEYGFIGAPKDNIGSWGDAGSVYFFGLTSTACP